MADEVKNTGEDIHDTNTQDAQIAELQKKAQEYLDGWKRAKADYINYKKEVDAQKSEMANFAVAAVATRIIPIADNLHEAFKHLPQDLKNLEWIRGVEHIKKQVEDILLELGFKRIKTVGEKYDPNLHEALAMEVREGFKPDIIFEEITSGYMLHGKTMIAAKVKVAK